MTDVVVEVPIPMGQITLIKVMQYGGLVFIPADQFDGVVKTRTLKRIKLADGTPARAGTDAELYATNPELFDVLYTYNGEECAYFEKSSELPGYLGWFHVEHPEVVKPAPVAIVEPINNNPVVNADQVLINPYGNGPEPAHIQQAKADHIAPVAPPHQPTPPPAWKPFVAPESGTSSAPKKE